MEKNGRKYTTWKQCLLPRSLHSGSIIVFVQRRLGCDPKAHMHMLMTQGAHFKAGERQTTCSEDVAWGTLPLTERLRWWWQVCRLEGSCGKGCGKRRKATDTGPDCAGLRTSKAYRCPPRTQTGIPGEAPSQTGKSHARNQVSWEPVVGITIKKLTFRPKGVSFFLPNEKR